MKIGVVLNRNHIATAATVPAHYSCNALLLEYNNFIQMANLTTTAYVTSLLTYTPVLAKNDKTTI